MASFLTPNMNLVIPIPTVEIGPDWANEINASLSIIDAHDHSPGSGAPINPAAININTPLDFNNFDADGVRSVRFFPQVVALPASSPDIGSIYVAGNELYYNDVTGGHQIQITANGSVTGSSGTITGLPSGTASASYQSASGTFRFQQATNTAANMDVGSLILRYPGSYPTPTGNYISIQAPSSLASGYSITMPALPPQTSVMSMSSMGVISTSTYDNFANALGATGSNIIANNRTRTVAQSVGAGGVAKSPGCGSFNTTSGTPVAVTNLSVTIVTTGRPVFVGLVSDGAFAGGSFVGTSPNSAAQVGITRNATDISLYGVFAGTPGTSGSFVSLPSTVINYVDVVAAGTYTYQVMLQVGGSAPTPSAGISGAVLVAYEL